MKIQLGEEALSYATMSSHSAAAAPVISAELDNADYMETFTSSDRKP